MRVEQVISKVFNIKVEQVNDLSSRDTIEGWDSFGHLTLISELEEQLRVSIAIADAVEMVDVRKIKALLPSYGVKC